ncbi:MAG: Uma2 family endonuclease [Blastocatellia bacterium]
MTDKEFFALCQENETVIYEREVTGEIIERSLPGWQTSLRSTSVAVQVGNWIKQDESGLGFGAFTGFTLPNGAIRGPYFAWVLRSRIWSLVPEQRRGFLPLCPDFVVELLSDPEELNYFRKKMDEYIACGLRLGWLIDPEEKVVYVYRLGEPVQKLENANEISADPELPGFVLDLGEVWEPQL